MPTVPVRGLEARQGETAFAFLVLRMREAMSRDALVQVLRYVAPLMPDAEGFIAGLPPELEESLQIIGLPWAPPEAGHAVDAQRRLIEGASGVGVAAAWFYQTGTSLPSIAEENEAREDEEPSTAIQERLSSVSEDTEWNADAGWDVGDDPDTNPVAVSGVIGGDDEEEDEDDDDDDDDDDLDGDDDLDEDDDDDDDDDDEEDDDESEAEWSHGPPPQVAQVAFPVDHFPEVIEGYDCEDFGITFKLAGTALAGESTVLLGFHALWLAPYGGRYRNTAVTIDRTRHAAHLWVDRFAAPGTPDQIVHHLLWIVSKIDEVFPVVHARFEGATMQQKYGRLMGDQSEPFVLGGNPLRERHAHGGETAVDEWLATQKQWSNEELAHMLRELAIEIVTSETDSDSGEEVDAVFEGQGDVLFEAAGDSEADEDGEDDDGEDDFDDDDDDEADEDDDDDDDESEGNVDEDRGRQIASYAGELLKARARAGKLDPRVADRLLTVLDQPAQPAQRQRAVIDILGALRYRPAVPALTRIVERDANADDELRRAAVDALAACATREAGDDDPDRLDDPDMN